MKKLNDNCSLYTSALNPLACSSENCWARFEKIIPLLSVIRSKKINSPQSKLYPYNTQNSIISDLQKENN